MSQPPGQRVSDKLTWAREIIAQYEGTAADEHSLPATLRIA
jgi:hypothetical protein